MEGVFYFWEKREVGIFFLCLIPSLSIKKAIIYVHDGGFANKTLRKSNLRATICSYRFNIVTPTLLFEIQI